MTKRKLDAFLRNSRPTKQERLDVPYTKVASRAAQAAHMGKEREYLALRRILEQKAHQLYDELDLIFQQIVETKAKIEEQRQKQQKETEQ